MFSKALNHIIDRLAQAQKARLIHSYALIGGFAVSAWGVARATQDIALAVALGTSAPQALATYLGFEYESGSIDDPLQGVFSLSLKSEGQGVPVQLIVLLPKLGAVAFTQIETLTVLGCSVPVVNWQALVHLKLYAGGPVDLQDARNIVAVRKPDATAWEDLLAQADTLGLGQESRALLDASIWGHISCSALG